MLISPVEDSAERLVPFCPLQGIVPDPRAPAQPVPPEPRRHRAETGRPSRDREGAVTLMYRRSQRIAMTVEGDRSLSVAARSPAAADLVHGCQHARLAIAPGYNDWW